jgi:capsid protein
MSATWFDHAIATVAPRMAARRVMARQAFETLTRGYDGAARGRRTEGWRAPGSSADTEIGVAGALLRDRMRDLLLRAYALFQKYRRYASKVIENLFQ